MVLDAGVPLARRLSQIRVEGFASQAEIQAISRIGSEFEEALGDPALQDPESPEYFNRWRSALNLADEHLRIAVGWDRYNRLSALAAQGRIAGGSVIQVTPPSPGAD